jgi:hypothetical protein
MASIKGSRAGGPVIQKACRIFQWVERADPTFASVIRELCLEYALDARGGVTFLFPPAHCREAIVAAAESDAPESAVLMIKALIIPEHVTSLGDFARPLGNLNGLPFRPASGGFSAGGASFSVSAAAPAFTALGERPIAVYAVSGQVPPTVVAVGEAERYAPVPHQRPRVGGSGAAPAGWRATYAETLARTPVGPANPSPHLAAVASLLCWLREREPDTYTAVLPLLDYEPIITFYILLEPHKTSGEPLLSDAVLGAAAGVPEWASGHYFGPQGARAVIMAAAADATRLPCRLSVYASIDARRTMIQREYTGRDLAVEVVNATNMLQMQNRIVVKNDHLNITEDSVYPPATAALLAKRPEGYLAWLNEMRCHVGAMLASCRVNGVGPSSVFFFYSHVMRGNDYTGERPLTDPKKLDTSVSLWTEVTAIGVYLYTDNFLYLGPRTDAPLVASAPERSIPSVAVNRAASARATLEGARDDLSGTRPGHAGDVAAALTKLLQSTGGVLPDEVAAVVATAQVRA